MVTRKFRRHINERLTAFRDFADQNSFSLCRAVTYPNPEYAHCYDVPLSHIGQWLQNYLTACWRADWTVKDETLYLLLWDGAYLDEAPDWESVFAERPLLSQEDLDSLAQLYGDDDATPHDEEE